MQGVANPSGPWEGSVPGSGSTGTAVSSAWIELHGDREVTGSVSHREQADSSSKPVRQVSKDTVVDFRGSSRRCPRKSSGRLTNVKKKGQNSPESPRIIESYDVILDVAGGYVESARLGQTFIRPLAPSGRAGTRLDHREKSVKRSESRKFPGLGRSTRRTFVLLAAVATLSIVLSLVFLALWRMHVESLERDHALRTARSTMTWGRDFVERELRALLETPRGRTWRESFPTDVKLRYLELSPAMMSGVVPDQVVLFERRDGRFEPAAVIVGKALPPDAQLASDVSTAIISEPDGPVTRVTLVESVVVARVPADHYRLRVRVAVPNPGIDVTQTARFGAFVLLFYLTMLYAVLLAVYRAGRRQAELLHRAREKEIRLQAIGAVAEGIAHEVRNPLNAVSLTVQYLEKAQEKIGRLPQPEDFQRVYMEVGKIRKVIDNFVGFAKLRDMELSAWDMREAVEECARALGHLFDEAEVTIEVDGDGDSRLVGDRPKMIQVLRSILDNAVDAVRTVDHREIRVVVEGRRNEVRVAVRDSGESPSEHVLQSMFDPYFSTRPRAMGLGLTLAKTVVESHGGTIEAGAAKGGGCVVTVVLPQRF